MSFSQETSISKLILIDNYFPDLIETSTFMLYDVQQIAIAFYPKIKKYQHNLIPYISYYINLQFQSLVFHFQDIEKLNLPPVVLLKHLIFNRLKYLHKSTNILPIWKTFSHFSSAMRSFVRQVHYIDRDLLCGSLLQGLGSLNLCSVLRTLQSPVGFLRFHRHYHFDNGSTISYNKSANKYYNWIVSQLTLSQVFRVTNVEF